MPHTSCTNSADGQLPWSHGSGGLQHRQQVVHQVRQVGHDLLTCARPSHYFHAHAEQITRTRTSTPCQDSSRNIIIIMYAYYALINALNTHVTHMTLNAIFYTHIEHSPIKICEILYSNTHMHACTHTHPNEQFLVSECVHLLRFSINISRA